MKYAPSTRFRPYVKKVITCGHWREAKEGERRTSGNDKALLYLAADASITVAYQLHDGGNEWNAPRNFATEAGAICGCTFVEHRNRRRSRKNPNATEIDPALEKSRAAARDRVEAAAVERTKRQAIEKRERELRDIRDLMGGRS